MRFFEARYGPLTGAATAMVRVLTDLARIRTDLGRRRDSSR